MILIINNNTSVVIIVFERFCKYLRRGPKTAAFVGLRPQYDWAYPRSIYRKQLYKAMELI